MKKNRFCFLAAAVLSLGGLLGAKEFDNILLYKNCGTWQGNASVIQSGLDKARIAWDGKALRFVPRGGTFDLKDICYFGFAIRVPEKMKDKPFTVTFVYDEGKPVVWNLRTPPHTGWRSACAKLSGKDWPYIRKARLKAVEFTAKAPDFQAFLDDIRFVPDGLDFKLHDEWVPPVTDGCFFPEYTLEQQRQETLNDPDFKAKMAEIEQLRKTRLKVTLKKEHTDPKQLFGLPDIRRIRPDGTVKGLSYEDVVKIHEQARNWQDLNETYIKRHCDFYRKLLSSWEWGRVPRTKENRRKLIRSLIRTLTAESNRRHEYTRCIVPAFELPTVTCYAYGIFFDDMEAVEKGTCHDPDLITLNRLLKETASWCYFHTFYQTLAPTLTLATFRGDSNWTGGNFGYRPTLKAALVCRNPKMLELVSEVAKNALSVTSYNTMKDAFWLDGMTADGSSWGHRNQNYPFEYPLNGFNAVGRMMVGLVGTRWALEADGHAFDLLCNHLETLLWYGTAWSPNKNRNIAPVGPLLQLDIPAACGRRGLNYREGQGYLNFGTVYWVAKNFCALAPEGSKQRERIQHCMDVITGKVRELPVGARYFWNNDLMLCREKESIAAVSMLSSRILSIESAPSASHFTDFWSDGAAWIMKHFDSYRIARGFLKMYAIPGVTSRQWDFKHETNNWRSYTGLYNFAGGAADGSYSVCGYKMGRKRLRSSPDANFYDLEAEKSYFWLNGKLICIGTGITDKTSRNVPVATTLDQTLWRGPAQDASGTIRKPGTSFQTDSQLLWHDGVGYAVLNGRGKLSGETRKDRWVEINGTNRGIKNLPKTAPILMFQIDHGKNPKNDSYAYAVDFHSPDFAALKKLAQQPSFEIVSATSDAHVVREKSSGTLAAVFFKPGEAGGLKVDAPAVVLMRETPDGKVRVTVNDPEQDPKRDCITLVLNGETYKVKLPSGVYCGQPATAELSGPGTAKKWYKIFF